MSLSILFSPKPFVGNDAVNQRNALASWRRIAGDVELICYGDGEGVFLLREAENVVLKTFR